MGGGVVGTHRQNRNVLNNTNRCIV